MKLEACVRGIVRQMQRHCRSCTWPLLGGQWALVFTLASRSTVILGMNIAHIISYPDKSPPTTNLPPSRREVVVDPPDPDDYPAKSPLVTLTLVDKADPLACQACSMTGACFPRGLAVA